MKRDFAFLSLIIATILVAISQIFLKLASTSFEHGLLALLTNKLFIVGFSINIVGFVLLIHSFKNIELSVAHPILSLGYVWALVMASVFLSELITFTKLLGIGSILFGVVFLRRSKGVN
tara:strand:+ start:1007 stop:1363 length:357 start_codon:yes stop_codon:yes gene_type:complete